MKEKFSMEFWTILVPVITVLASLIAIYWGIIKFKDSRKEKKAKQISDSAEIKDLLEDFEKWLNDEYIFDEESFEKKEGVRGNYKCFSFSASLSELDDIKFDELYKKLLFDYENVTQEQIIIYVKEERYDLYQQYQCTKAEKYRVSINEKWEQLERNLNRVGYKSLKDIKFLSKVDKKSLEAIENLKNKALSVNDEILRKRN